MSVIKLLYYFPSMKKKNIYIYTLNHLHVSCRDFVTAIKHESGTRRDVKDSFKLSIRSLFVTISHGHGMQCNISNHAQYNHAFSKSRCRYIDAKSPRSSIDRHAVFSFFLSRSFFFFIYFEMPRVMLGEPIATADVGARGHKNS